MNEVDDLGMVTLPFCERELKALVNALRSTRRIIGMLGHAMPEEEIELLHRLEHEFHKVKAAKAQRDE